MGKDWSHRKIEEYPTGKKIEVFYNPDDPKISCLEPGGSLKYILSTIKLIIVFCCAFFLLAYICYWDYRRVKNAVFDSDNRVFTIK